MKNTIKINDILPKAIYLGNEKIYEQSDELIWVQVGKVDSTTGGQRKITLNFTRNTPVYAFGTTNTAFSNQYASFVFFTSNKNLNHLATCTIAEANGNVTAERVGVYDNGTDLSENYPTFGWDGYAKKIRMWKVHGEVYDNLPNINNTTTITLPAGTNVTLQNVAYFDKPWYITHIQSHVYPQRLYALVPKSYDATPVKLYV